MYRYDYKDRLLLALNYGPRPFCHMATRKGNSKVKSYERTCDSGLEFTTTEYYCSCAHESAVGCMQATELGLTSDCGVSGFSKLPTFLGSSRLCVDLRSPFRV